MKMLVRKLTYSKTTRSSLSKEKASLIRALAVEAGLQMIVNIKAYTLPPSQSNN
jgi:hypothetical protein